MKLKTFSVVGEALNFGGRRMETIMRVSWLPVVLLLILNMAGAFAVLSVANGRIITFSDIIGRLSYQQTAGLSQQALQAGLMSGSIPMWTIFLATGFLNAVLVASFMAPLIRYAGLGERPQPGVIRLAFGPDQIRYMVAGLFSVLIMTFLIYAPIAGAAYWALKYVFEAMQQTYVLFPDPNSLHTIELVGAQEVLAQRGELWKYTFAAPLAAAAPFLVALWAALIWHFRKQGDDPASGRTQPVARILISLLATVLLAALGAYVFTGGGKNVQALPLAMFPSAALLVPGYPNLRLFPFAGVAVCRKSLAPAHMLRVTRRWNIVRLFFALFVTSAIFIVVQFLINAYAFTFIAWTINITYQATLTATKLVNSGEGAEWVLPFFIWIWNGVKILVNIFWTFFSYGVLAGLQGRLYRESEEIGPVS